MAKTMNACINFTSWHLRLNGRKRPVSTSVIVALSVLTHTTVFALPAVAQSPLDVPVDIRQAIGQALGGETSTPSNAPMTVQPPDHTTPAPVAPPEGFIVLKSPEFSGPVHDAPEVTPETGISLEDPSPPHSAVARPLPGISSAAVPAHEPSTQKFSPRRSGNDQRLTAVDSTAEIPGVHVPDRGHGFAEIGNHNPPLTKSCAWQAAGPIPWQAFAHEDFVGPAKMSDAAEYRLRVNDELELNFCARGQTNLDQVGIDAPSYRAQVTQSGHVSLPVVGSIQAQGLSLRELKREIEAAYAQNPIKAGLDVTATLVQPAARSIYVVGEVKSPGRFQLSDSTTVVQGVELAGRWTSSANLRHVLVVRRDPHGNLLAARLDLQRALKARGDCPARDFMLHDADVVLVPKRAIRDAADALQLLRASDAAAVLTPPQTMPSLTSL